MAYSSEDGAPRVVAKGSGISAEAIVSLANEHGVYVHQSPELVSLLMQVDLDSEIPPELYQAVAELLAWLYALDQGMSEGG